VALGLMGVLEIMWQNIAFHNESDIDRAPRSSAPSTTCDPFFRAIAHAGGAAEVTRTRGVPTFEHPRR